MPWPIISFISISIPAFREEGDAPPAPPASGAFISIPAFREEGDSIPF